MSSKYSANLAFLLLVNIFIKPFYLFVIDRGVQNATGETYGLYAALLSSSLLFYIVLDIGLTHYNNREVAQNKRSLLEGLPKMLAIKAILAVVYLITMLGLVLVLQYGLAEVKWLIWLSINQILLSLILFFRSCISGLQHFKADAIVSVTDKVLLIIIAGSLLIHFSSGNFPIEYFIYAHTMAYCGSLLLTIGILWPWLRRVSWHLPVFREVSGFVWKSLPYASVILLMTMYYRIDTIMIERLLPAHELLETAIYAAAFRQMDAAQNIAILFTVILLPLYARMLKRKQNFMEIASGSFNLLGVFALVLLLPCWFVPEKIMAFLYPSLPEDYSGMLLSILMTSFIPMCCIFIYGTLLTADARLKLLNKIVLLGALLNVSLNFWLIPEFKALAAAYTSLATQSLMAILKMWFVYVLFGPLMPAHYALRWVVMIMLSIAGSWLLFMLEFPWWLFTISSAVCTFVMAWAAGIFSLKTIRFFLP